MSTALEKYPGSVHIRWLAALPVTPAQRDLIPSGFCRHPHMHARKLTQAKHIHMNIFLSFEGFMYINIIVVKLCTLI